jgi:hypothetical protein
MHTHNWEPVYESMIPIVRVPYTLMKCSECGDTYPLPKEGF